MVNQQPDRQAFMGKDGKGGTKTLAGFNFEKKVDFFDLLKGINGYIIGLV
jgi:hypothetical protein